MFSRILSKLGAGGKESKEERANNVKILRGENDELVLEFDNPVARDDFLEKLGRETIAEDYGRGDEKQYAGDPKWRTPVVYVEKPTRLYFPSHVALNGNIAVRFASKTIRDRFIKLLKLNETLTTKTTYQRLKFTTNIFRREIGHVSSEKTLYFNQDDPIFKTPLAFVSINMQNGTIVDRDPMTKFKLLREEIWNAVLNPKIDSKKEIEEIQARPELAEKGWTVLHILATSNTPEYYSKVMARLMTMGLDPNQKDVHGLTASGVAQDIFGNTEFNDVLAKIGIPTEEKSKVDLSVKKFQALKICMGIIASLGTTSEDRVKKILSRDP